MTDYLARAMEQDEEDRRELPEALRNPETGRTVPPSGGQEPSGEARERETSPVTAGAVPEERGPVRQDRPFFNEQFGDRTGERQVSPTLEERPVLPASPADTPADIGVLRVREDLPPPLLRELRRARTGTDFVRRERRNLSVTLPEAPAVAGGLSAEELDRTVERDARRYDGGFSLY